MARIITHYPEEGPSLYIDFAKVGEGMPLSYTLMHAVRIAIRETLAAEGVNANCEVSFTLCDDAYIRTLNKTHRNKDTATDVLSFPMLEADEPLSAEGESPVLLGDIVVSSERAAEQAKALDQSVGREILFLTVHSVLHLLGYDHERGAEDEEEMCRKQREIMARIDRLAGKRTEETKA